MGRRTIVVDKKMQQKAVNDAEKDGPLTNLSALYSKATDIYNSNDKKPEDVTIAVVGLRIKEFKIKHITIKGKKGRTAGFGGAPKGPRVKKADKFKNSPKAQKALKALKKNAGEEFNAIIEKIEAGSRAAAVKMKCIECMGFQRSEVKRCTCLHSPLYLFRPYKDGETVDEELTVKDAIS